MVTNTVNKAKQDNMRKYKRVELKYFGSVDQYQPLRLERELLT